MGEIHVGEIHRKRGAPQMNGRYVFGRRREDERASRCGDVRVYFYWTTPRFRPEAFGVVGQDAASWVKRIEYSLNSEQISM